MAKPVRMSSGGRWSRFDVDDGCTRQVKVFRWGENRREAKSFPTILIERSSDSKAVGPGEETDGFAFVAPYMPLPGRHVGLSNRHSGSPLTGPTPWKHVLPQRVSLGPCSGPIAPSLGENEEAPTGSEEVRPSRDRAVTEPLESSRPKYAQRGK